MIMKKMLQGMRKLFYNCEDRMWRVSRLSKFDDNGNDEQDQSENDDDDKIWRVSSSISLSPFEGVE